MLALWLPQVNDSKGNPVVIKNAICLHEEDAGILWKHVDGEQATAQLSTVSQHVAVRWWRACAVSLIAWLRLLTTLRFGLLSTAGCQTPFKSKSCNAMPPAPCCLAQCYSAHRPCGGAPLQEASVPTNLNVHGEAPPHNSMHSCEGVCLPRCLRCSLHSASDGVNACRQKGGLFHCSRLASINLILCPPHVLTPLTPLPCAAGQNYEYLMTYNFFQDGHINFETKLSGILSTSIAPRGEERPSFGVRVAPGVNVGSPLGVAVIMPGSLIQQSPQLS